MAILAVDLVVRTGVGFPAEGEFSVRVSLTSEMRPDIKTLMYVKADDDRLEHKVAVSAGAAAEHQCEIYHDTHNPDAIAKAAERMIRQLKAKGLSLNAKLERTNEGG